MTEYHYTDYERDADDNQPTGSPLITRFPEGWHGLRVNNSMAALASALRNLGDAAAKLPLDENGNPDNGPNNGRIGSMAWQDATDVNITTGILDIGVRGSVPLRTLISWYGVWQDLVDNYGDLRLRGWDLCDGRTVTNPYSPFNTITMPNLLGRYAYFYDDPAFLGLGAFGHTKGTTVSGAHNHTGSTGGVALIGGQLPTLARTTVNVEFGDGDATVTGSYAYSGAGASHGHEIATEAAHYHEVDVRPGSIVVVPLLRVW